MRETVALIEPDDGLRSQLVGLLASVGLHAEPFEELREYLLFRGAAGNPVIVGDDRVDALAVLDALGREGEWAAVIAYAAQPEVQRVVQVIRGGGHDFFALPIDAPALGRSIAGLAQYKSAYAQARLRAASARVKLGWLSPREAEVLAKMARGQSNKAIGIDLGISPRTVEIHRANMLAKLGANSTTEALRMYYEHDLLNGEAARALG